jgi:hypothetical protein
MAAVAATPTTSALNAILWLFILVPLLVLARRDASTPIVAMPERTPLMRWWLHATAIPMPRVGGFDIASGGQIIGADPRQ